MKKLLIALFVCSTANASITLNNVTLYNQCILPVVVGLYYPLSNTNQVCQLGGTEQNPDSYPFRCNVDGAADFGFVLYNEQNYFFHTSYTSKQGAVCYFDNCSGFPLRVDMKCISSSIGKDEIN